MVFVKTSTLPALLFAVSAMGTPLDAAGPISTGGNNSNVNTNTNTNTNTNANANGLRGMGYCSYSPDGTLLPITYDPTTITAVGADIDTPAVELDALSKRGFGGFGGFRNFRNNRNQNINQNINNNQNTNANRFRNGFGGFGGFKRDLTERQFGNNQNQNINQNINQNQNENENDDGDGFDRFNRFRDGFGFRKGFGRFGNRFAFGDGFGFDGNSNVNVNNNVNANTNRLNDGFRDIDDFIKKRDAQNVNENINTNENINGNTNGFGFGDGFGDFGGVFPRAEGEKAVEGDELEKRGGVGSANFGFGRGLQNNNQPNNVNRVGSNRKNSPQRVSNAVGNIIKRQTPNTNQNQNQNINTNTNANTNAFTGVNTPVVCGYDGVRYIQL